MPLLIVFLALLFPTPIQAEDLQVRIDVAPGLSQVLPANQPVQALVLSAFTRRFGQLVDARDAHAAVSLDRSGNVISITTRMVRGASSKSLRSTVPSTGLGTLFQPSWGTLHTCGSLSARFQRFLYPLLPLCWPFSTLTL